MTDPAIHDTAVSGVDKQSLSVLIVDDEPAMVEMMSIVLEGTGHKVLATADNGPDAIRLASEKQPDLIIMDVGMPGMDGITVAEKILAVQSVPIIIVTGITREETVDRAGQLEIQSYLTKPFSKEQFLSAIRLAVVRHRNAQSDREKIKELTSEIEMSKIINRAVELLIGKFGIDRPEAMEKLEAAARARSCSVAEAAKAISTTLGR